MKIIEVIDEGLTIREKMLVEVLAYIVVASGMLADHVEALTGPELITTGYDVADWIKSLEK